MIYYFGYGSNMNLISLKAKGVTPHLCIPSVLEGWRLTFSVPDFFKIEGGTGNIEPEPGHIVHGVLYQCDQKDLASLDEIEALGICYERKKLVVRNYQGETFQAFVYIGIKSRMENHHKPSQRYLNILIQGATKSGLDPSYIETLKKTETTHLPVYPVFKCAEKKLKIYTPEDISNCDLHTSIGGYVFDMSEARKEHDFLKSFLEKKDVTKFFLKRMDNSTESDPDIETLSKQLTNAQKRYLNAYIHEFNKEYRLAGKTKPEFDLQPVQSPKFSKKYPLGEKALQTETGKILAKSDQHFRQSGNENYGFLSEKFGLMPRAEPLSSLGPEHAEWDYLATSLPKLYQKLRVRKDIDQLPILSAKPQDLEDQYLLRAASVLSMLSHAYWHCEVTPPTEIPQSLSRPWQDVRERLGRKAEVLNYIDLIVYNWKLSDPENKERVVENMSLMIPTIGNREEQIFYLTQVEILAKCSPIIGMIVRSQEAILENNPDKLGAQLIGISECLLDISYESLLKIDPNIFSRQYMNPVIWAKTVAPFAVPFHQGIQGPSGTSSPVFNLLDLFLGRKLYNSFLGKEIFSLRNQYPRAWVEFLNAAGNVSISEYISSTNNPDLQGILKDTLDVYAGENGFLGRHKMKVYGYLETAFKVGRSVTIGGFSGPFKDRTWDLVDLELEKSRTERIDSFPKGCHYGIIKSVSQTHNMSPENVKNIIIDIKGSGVKYRPGDRCFILPENRKELIDKTIDALGAGGDETIRLNKRWKSAVKLRYGYESRDQLSLREFLTFAHLRPVNEFIAESLHACTQNTRLLHAIQSHNIHQWELWDLLLMLKKDGYSPDRLLVHKENSYEYLSYVVPPLDFVPYSISSSMLKEEGHLASEIHLLVGQVIYDSEATDYAKASKRFGTASHFLSHASGREKPVSFYVERPARFHLPKNLSAPIVMIAGGTGLSPFRSFIFERCQQESAGPAYLFLSVQSRDYFYYQDDLIPALARSKLKLFVIFSQDEAHVTFKRLDENTGCFQFEEGQSGYISDLLLKDDIRTMLWNLIRSQESGGEGAYFYICGRTRFSRTVQVALNKIVQISTEIGTKNKSYAHDSILQKMVSEGRLIHEIFTNILQVRNDIPEYHISEIVSHSSENKGYWMIIQDKVFDLTEFMELHPGGDNILLNYVGIDATIPFIKVHQSKAEISAIRDIYFIGVVRKLTLPDDDQIRNQVTGRNTTLSGFYNGWRDYLFLVTEMKNTLRGEQSFFDKDIDPNVYMIQRKIDTHQRFLIFYFNELLGNMTHNLWDSMGDFFGLKDQPRWLNNVVKAFVDSIEYQSIIAFPKFLHKLLNQFRRSGTEDLFIKKMNKYTEDLMNFDFKFLESYSEIIIKGIKIFEHGTPSSISTSKQKFADLLLDITAMFQDYVASLMEKIEQHDFKDELNTMAESFKIHEQNSRSMILTSEFWKMEEDENNLLIFLTRSSVPATSLEQLMIENRKVLETFSKKYAQYGIVIDMRLVRGRNDPDFEHAMAELRLKIYKNFRRVGLVLKSNIGILQVNRLGLNEGVETFASLSESATISFCKGS